MCAWQSVFSGGCTQKTIKGLTKSPQKQEFPLKCTKGNITQTCPRDYPTTHKPTNPDRPFLINTTCPSYFRWIHEDLRHWKDTGITRDMVERARRTAHFRLLIVDGKAYVEKYRPSIQTRDTVHFVGHLAAPEVVPWEIARFGPHV
jgi:hypothetical protein